MVQRVARDKREGVLIDDWTAPFPALDCAVLISKGGIIFFAIEWVCHSGSLFLR